MLTSGQSEKRTMREGGRKQQEACLVCWRKKRLAFCGGSNVGTNFDDVDTPCTVHRSERERARYCWVRHVVLWLQKWRKMQLDPGCQHRNQASQWAATVAGRCVLYSSFRSFFFSLTCRAASIFQESHVKSQ
uniref:Uncharacterized protein n=1 Tax=Hyaloperonospora arabidopsidis (strain Emoy2) TaxID=559515 RepID=M4BNL5_HYAAE